MLRLDSVFSDRALFQHSAPLRICGEADSTVRVEIRRGDKVLASGCAAPNSKGCFEININTPSASFEAATMVFTSENDSILVSDVLFGELWIAGGQSNMELPNGEHPDYAIRRSDFISAGIRAYHPKQFSFDDPMPRVPQRYGEGVWLSPEDEGFADVAALASAFALQACKSINAPVGFLNLNRGGSRLETWLPERAMNDWLASYLKLIGRFPTEENWNSFGNEKELPNKNFQQFSAYYNRAVAPLAGLSVKGVLWYQGESNCVEHCKHGSYPALLELLRKSWQEDFGIPGEPFPFYVSTLFPPCTVDLTVFMGRFNVALAQMAEQHPDKYHVVPNSDLSPSWAVHAKNHPVHPVNKYVLGERFAKMILSSCYKKGKEEDGQAASLCGMERTDGALTLKFRNVGSGLFIDGGSPRGLYVSDDTGRYLPAKCEVVSTDTLRVWHPGIPSPKEAAYAVVGSEPQCNLYAGSYPVIPFFTARVDDLREIQIQKRPWCDLNLDGDIHYNGAIDAYRRAVFTAIPGSGCCYDSDYALGSRSLRVYAEGNENTFGVRIQAYSGARLDLGEYSALRMSVFPLRCLEAELHLIFADQSRIIVGGNEKARLSIPEWGEIEFKLPELSHSEEITAMEWRFSRTEGVPFGILNIAEEAAGINIDNVYLVP